jgi:hypothetical protein
MPHIPAADLPNWPSLMDVHAAAAYLAISEGSFRKLAARSGIQPVDLGLSVMRWRRSDLDRLIEKLPHREPTADPENLPLDPTQAALDRVRRRHGRSHETR